MEAPQKVIEISQPYVDDHLREYFEVNHTPVNIDNICLFSAKTIEEYNQHSEVKLSGKQKLEAAIELAKNVIDKTMVFVPEEERRKVSKNIFHNIDSVESTIQFIIDISNSPNIINAGKWIRSSTVSKDAKRGFFARLFCCVDPQTEKEEEPKEEPKEEAKEEAVKEETGEEPKEESVKDKKQINKEKKEKKKSEELEKKEKKKSEELEKKEKKKSEELEKKEKKKSEELEKKEKKKSEELEKKEREKKIKELIEETDRKVKELKGEIKPPPQEKEVEVEI